MKLVTTCLLAATACTASVDTDPTDLPPPTEETARKRGSLPVDKIEQILGAEGELDNGVLVINIQRSDIGNVQGPLGITLTPAFEIEADLYFQPIGRGQAILNGDFVLKESEVNPFIAALLENGLEWQAFHQHLPTSPQIWFVHYRGVDNPLTLARALRNAINVTSTPLPQMMPQNPTTPLDADRLAKILHGTATVGDEGVVTVDVSRSHGVLLGGVPIKPETGIQNVIQFKPTGGNNADVVADFSMTAREIRPVVETMLLGFKWFQGCLYNQETAEKPQLYFDHMAKRGDAYELARQIRAGLDETDAE